MKYFTVLFLFCLPLIVLTAISFIELLGSSEALEAAAMPANVRPALDLSSKTTARIAPEIDVVRALADVDLFNIQLQPIEVPSTPKPIVESLKRCSEVHALVLKYSSAKLPLIEDASAATADGKLRIESAVTALSGFLKNEKAAFLAVEAAAPVIALLEKRLSSHEGELLRQKKSEEIDKALIQARAELTPDGKPEKCLLLLEAETLKSATDPTVTAELAVLRKRATYRVPADKLTARTTTAAPLEDLLRAYGDFLKEHPNEPSPDETLQHGQIIKAREKTVLELAIKELAKPANFEVLLERGSALAANISVDAAVKGRVRDQVIQWLKGEGLLKKPSPLSLQGMQEAWTKNSDRKIGSFRLPEGGVNWKYWVKAVPDRILKPQGDEQFSKDSLAKQPDTPMYVQWIDAYNADADALLTDGGTLEQWQQFQSRCLEWQTQLVKYRIDWPPIYACDNECRNLDFSEQAKLAQKIIDNWSRFRLVVGK